MLRHTFQRWNTQMYVWDFFRHIQQILLLLSFTSKLMHVLERQTEIICMLSCTIEHGRTESTAELSKQHPSIPPASLLKIPCSPHSLFSHLFLAVFFLSHAIPFLLLQYKSALLLFSPFWAGSIKSSRRSSYLLAITTERSKSCDDGLHNLRDDGRVFSWVF